MRTSRILLASVALAFLAACATEPVGVVKPDSLPSLEETDQSGSPYAIDSDTTVVSTGRGGGFVGSGN